MPIDNLKIDLINGAYSQMRISGLTVQPSAPENKLALRRLESLANELSARNICMGYNFEDSPDVNSTSGLDVSLWYSVECVLASRLLSDFGKGQQPDPMLLRNMQSGMSFLYSITANPTETQYPSRQPIGSGTSLRNNRFRRFYQPQAESPNTCKTKQMVIDNIDDFVEHFDAYLIDSEIIDSFTIEAETGLTIVSSSNTDQDVLYRIQAVGNAGSKSDLSLNIKIVITTDSGRIETRLIYFDLTDISI